MEDRSKTMILSAISRVY